MGREATTFGSFGALGAWQRGSQQNDETCQHVEWPHPGVHTRVAGRLCAPPLAGALLNTKVASSFGSFGAKATRKPHLGCGVVGAQPSMRVGAAGTERARRRWKAESTHGGSAAYLNLGFFWGLGRLPPGRGTALTSRVSTRGQLNSSYAQGWRAAYTCADRGAACAGCRWPHTRRRPHTFGSFGALAAYNGKGTNRSVCDHISAQSGIMRLPALSFF